MNGCVVDGVFQIIWYFLILNWSNLLVTFNYKVGGVQKEQNVDYVIHGWSLQIQLSYIKNKNCLILNV